MAGILKVDQVQSDSNLAFAIAGSNVAFMNATSLQMVSSNVSLAGTNVITNGKVLATAMHPGAVLQVVNLQSGTYASTTTVIPVDDTIPQNTEGAEFFTLAITPTSATSKLLIQLVVQTAPTTAGWITVALFQDSTVNALAAASIYNATSTGGSMIPLNYYMTAGTTSSTTFKMRYGPNSGVTAVINGSGATRQYGGVNITSMTITEIAA